MKKTIKSLLGALCLIGLILGSCEEPDGSCNLAWTIGWLAASGLSGWGLKKMEDRSNG